MTTTAVNHAVGIPTGRPALLINRCAELGITLTVADGVLHVDAPDLPYMDAFLDELANHKTAILDALTPSPVSYTHLTLPTTPYV